MSNPNALKLYAAVRLGSLLLMGTAYAGEHGDRDMLRDETREIMPHQVSRHFSEAPVSEGQTSEPHVTKTQVVEYKKDETEYAEAVKQAWQVGKKLEEVKAHDGEASDLEQKAHTLAQSIHTLEEKLEDAIESGVQSTLVGEGISASFSEKPSLLRKVATKFSSKEEENVLCLDGGGMRGVGTLTMLAALEMKTGLKTYQLFDRIYGTSTGGLAAIMLARGLSALEVLNLYTEEGKVIFGRGTWDMITNPGGLLGATYNPSGLESVITKYVGDATLSDVKIPVTVTSVNSRTGSLQLLSSEDEETKGVTMLDAGRATSAAPTYFPARKVKTKSGEYTAVDGGVGFNNPAMIAYDHAKESYKAQGRKVRINMLSLGTGDEAFLQLDENAGKLGFGNPGNIPGYFMGIKAKEVEDSMERLHKKGKLQSYARVQFGLDQKVDLADYSESTLKKLQMAAWNRAHDQEMSDFAKLLSKQKRKVRQ